MRLHIVGGPGSGKTTLAREAGRLLGIIPIDLDRVVFDGASPPGGWCLGSKPPGTRASRDRLALDVRTILAGRAWVTEGIYIGWTEPLLHEADLIVWLDTPARVALWRILVRHARASMNRTNRHRGFRVLARFLRSSLHYYVGSADVSEEVMTLDEAAITRAATARVLQRWEEKVRRCRRRRAIRRVLRSIRTITS